jgi:predicted phosphoribosyltransferase
MITQFRNRAEAGRLLAQKLAKYAARHDTLVLGLPRGGVPVAYEVARQLNAPLDTLVARKLGVPGREELAMGAIASGGVRVINRPVVDALRIPGDEIEEVARREQSELERRERAYRDDRPLPDTRGRVVILVDDGVATGSTMYAAIFALRRLGAAKVVVAAPAIAKSTFDEMRRRVDDLVAIVVAEEFYGVGQWYADFSQTTDEEVRSLLEKANAPPSGTLP